MSSRRKKQPTSMELATQLRAEIEELKTQNLAIEAAAMLEATQSEKSIPPMDTNEKAHASPPSFQSLSPVEQSAASLGVDPAALKPIAWLNNSHFEALIKANAVDDNLARRIAAFAHVSAASATAAAQ